MSFRERFARYLVRERIRIRPPGIDSEKLLQKTQPSEQDTSTILKYSLWNTKATADENSNYIDIILVASVLYYIFSIGGSLSVALLTWSSGNTTLIWVPEDALISILTALLIFLTVWPIARLGGLWRQELPKEVWGDVTRLSERVGATSLIPLCGAMIGAWSFLPGSLRVLLIGVFVLSFIHMWIIQNKIESGVSERFQHLLSNMWVMPVWISIGGFIILSRATEAPFELLRWPAVSLPVFVVGFLSYLWLRSDKRHLQIHKRDIKPIQNKHLRRILFLLQWFIVFFHFILLIMVAAEIGDYYNLSDFSWTGFLSPSLRTLEELFSVFPWPVSSTMFVYLILLMLPILIILTMWVHNLISEFQNRRSVLRTADTAPSDQLGFTPDVPVLQSELNRPGAMLVPIWHKRRSVIVFDRKTIEQLDPPHLEVLYHHECYHLIRQHEWKMDLLRVVCPLVGGINATLTYWFPSISERRADCYAAHRTSKDTVSNTIAEIYRMGQDHSIVDPTEDSEPDTPMGNESLLTVGGSGDPDEEGFRSANPVHKRSPQPGTVNLRQAYWETYSLIYGSILRGEEFSMDERILLVRNECHPEVFDNS